MGVDVLIIDHWSAPTLLDTAATVAAWYLASVLAMIGARRIWPQWQALEELQLLAGTSAIPIHAALVAGVLIEFPAYVDVAIAAAAVAVPLGIAAMGPLDPRRLPDGALDLQPGRRRRLGAARTP